MKYLKKYKKIYLLAIICLALFIGTYTTTYNYKKDTISYSANVIKVASGLKTGNTIKASANNTTYLQNLVDEVSDNGGGTIKIPAGTYHFSTTKKSPRNLEYYIIKCRDNVKIVGAGNVDGTGTILKPTGTLDVPIDMFYFNDYADSGYETPTYLVNADFENFIIDGSSTKGEKYTTAGKGFMINLYKDCDWNNITVRYTDGTGFGMDNPINSTISNSTAVGCGKLATSSNDGASGFGIGIGYSKNESIRITNCKSYGNKKYGFFFEHQGRFSPAYYKALTAKSLIVEDSAAYGNMYNFGGEKAYDVIYRNNKSYAEDPTYETKISNVSAMHFDTSSKRTKIVNLTVDYKFKDVPSTHAYYKYINWAMINGLVEGGPGNSSYSPDAICPRAQAITLLYRLENRPGTISLSNTKLTTFTDVDKGVWFEDAIDWGVDTGIISQTTSFRPLEGINRAEFITMLWRLAGKPTPTGTTKFDDLGSGQFYVNAAKWAASQKIIPNYNGPKFGPVEIYTKAEVIQIIYNYVHMDSLSDTTEDNKTEDNKTTPETKPEVEKPSKEEQEDNKKDEIIKIPETKPESDTKDEPQTDIPEIGLTEDLITTENFLKQLYLSNGTLVFKTEQKSYTVTVPYQIESTEIIAIGYTDNTDIYGSGKKDLKVGTNNFKVVAAKSNKYSIYEITIIRKEQDNKVLNENNYLKKLSITNYEIPFDKDKYAYSVPYKILLNNEINAEPEASTSKVSIIGNEDIKVGNNIKVIVTAETGQNRIYQINIIEKEETFFDKYFIEICIGTLIVLTLIFTISIIKVYKRKK